MFERYVSIDWSGAGREEQPVDLAVMEAWRVEPTARIMAPPPGGRPRWRWSRAECRDWLLHDVLGPNRPRCLVACDFGFGLPYGADQALFEVSGWHRLVERLAALYAAHGTARAVAMAINAWPRFDGHGPYRMDDTRADFQFYLRHQVGYYRLVDGAVPQAISQWYLGSGGTVGFHAITGMAMLHALLERRQTGAIDFRVWPQEGAAPPERGHVLVESYPAICRVPGEPRRPEDEHHRDARRVLDWMLRADRADQLGPAFQLPPLPFGRVEGVSFAEQVRFEGWILGVTRGGAPSAPPR